MPSIEIVCVGQKSPADFSDLPFAVEASRELRSHRSPKALFQADFDHLNGCMYHLGNPGLKNTRRGDVFFAYGLLSAACRHREPPLFLEFDSIIEPAVRAMLQALMKASP